MCKLNQHVLLLWRRFKHTCRNLTVHGPSYLARKDVHCVYRIIYFIIYFQVWIAAVVTIRGYFSQYNTNTMRFTTRTDYLDWNTTFASVTVCEIANMDKIWQIGPKLDDQYNDKLDFFVKEVAFFEGKCYSCGSTCAKEPMCLTDYTKLSKHFRSSCDDLFLNCKWDDQTINCCDHFRPLQTEYGQCFSINNKHTGPNDAVYVIPSSRSQQGVLEITLSQDYEAFIHAPEDIPFWNVEYDRRISVVYGSGATVSFSIIDVVNEPEVVMVSPEVRECRFPEEIPDNYFAYSYYSYSVCITQCRIDAQLELCNCTHHLSPVRYKNQYCDLEGLQCLTEHYKTLRRLKVPDSNETGLDCDCLPSCIEPDYNVISKKLVEPEQVLKVKPARFILGNIPYQRVTRQVARTTLDLVVAIGNCFGLCFGGSLLSVVEIFYYLCFKRWKYDKGK